MKTDENGIHWPPLIKLVKRPDGQVKSYLASTDVEGTTIEHVVIDLADCPCDPRRRHERLAQKVGVV